MAEGRGHEKQAGAMVYLMEELGDARLRCDQLQRYIDQAIKLIEKSEHKDHFFEVAGDLIRGIPETTFKLHKSLQAVALAAGRIDYEEIKQDLRPEKAEELERVLKDVRIRHVQRRSEPMKPIEALNALKALKAKVAETGKFPLADTLALVTALEEGLPKDASADKDFEKLATMLSNPPENTQGPSRQRLAQILRHVVANHIAREDITALRVAGAAWEQNELKEMQDLLKKSGYDPKDAKKLQKEGMGPTELERRLKVKSGEKGSLDYTHGLKKKASDFEDREAKGKFDIQDLNQLRKTLEDILVEARKAKNKDIENLAKKELSKLATDVTARTGGDPRWLTAKYPGKTSDGEAFKKGEKVLYFPNTKTFLKGSKAEAAWRKFEAEAADEAVYNFKGAGDDDKQSRFEEGKPADPTKNMDPEDVKKWKSNTEEYGDKFKKEAADTSAAGAVLDVEGDPFMAGPIVRALKSSYKAGGTATGLNEKDVDENVKEAVTELRALLKVLERQPPNALPKLSEIAIHVWQLAYYLGASKTASKTAGDDEKESRFEEGKPADPTKDMSPEDAKKWKENTEEYGDKFKSARVADPQSFFKSMKESVEALLDARVKTRKVQDGLTQIYQDASGASFTDNYNNPEIKSVAKELYELDHSIGSAFRNIERAEKKLKGMVKSAGDDDKQSRFEEGKLADPTKNMSEEDAKKWKENVDHDGSNIKKGKYNTLNDFEKGDIVRWTRKHLQQTGQHTSKTINGKVVGKSGNFVQVHWNNYDEPTFVSPAAIELDPQHAKKKASVDPWKVA